MAKVTSSSKNDEDKYLFPVSNEMKKLSAVNRGHCTLDKREHMPKEMQKLTGRTMSGVTWQEVVMITKCMHMTVGVSMFWGTNASSKNKVELNSHGDTSVVGDSCLIVHDHGRLFEVFGNDARD